MRSKLDLTELNVRSKFNLILIYFIIYFENIIKIKLVFEVIFELTPN